MSTTLDVVFQHRATRDIEEINAWWRANREAAADLFLFELRATLSIAALSPTLGAPARDVRLLDTCTSTSQPPLAIAGMMNFVQMSRSERAFLSTGSGMILASAAARQLGRV